MTRFHSWSGGGGCFVNNNDNACHTDGTNYLVQQEAGANRAKDGWHLKGEQKGCIIKSVGLKSQNKSFC